MYTRLRGARTKPTACLLCTILSSASNATTARHYAAQSVLASQPSGKTQQPSGPTQQSVSSIASDRIKSSGSKKKRAKLGAIVAEVELGRQLDDEIPSKTARRALKEAQESERRRRALATLDKSSKFIAAGLQDAHEPTYADLDRLKPARPPLVTLDFVYPRSSPQLHRGSPTPSTVEHYRSAFNKLVDTLCSKFRRKQLLKLYKEGLQKTVTPLPGKPRRIGNLKTSQDVAGEIMRWLWEWPRVEEVDGRMTYLTTRSEREFLISTSEFFLLLGPDGSSLRALTESHAVLLKRVERTNEAFKLVLEGPSFMLDQLANILTDRKKRIISEVVRIDSDSEPSGNGPSCIEGNSIHPELLQRISKLTNALVEDLGNGTFRIFATNVQNIEISKRLVMHASQQTKLPQSSLLAFLSTSKDPLFGLISAHNYALFPIELSNKERLPFYWTSVKTTPSSQSARTDLQDHTRSSVTSHSSSNRSYIYRARKVSDWLEERPANSMRHIGPFSDGVGRLIDRTGQFHGLRTALGLPELDSPEIDQYQPKKITASLGHIAFAPAVGPKSLLPTLRGSWLFEKLFVWMKDNETNITFIPGLPNPLLNMSPLGQTVLNRLVYRSSTPTIPANEQVTSGAIPSTLTLKFEIPFPESVLGEKESGEHSVRCEVDCDTFTPPRYNVQGSSIGQQPPSMEDYNSQFMGHHVPSLGLNLQPNHSPQFWQGVETFVNLMLPDRPMDVQLSSFWPTPVPLGAEPPELRDYASNLMQSWSRCDTTRPIPPLHVIHQGTRYILDTNATVRSSSHTIADIADIPSTEQMDITIENMVDSESNQHSDVCSVVCSEPNLASAWQKFLNVCDRLTWLRARKGFIPHTVYSE